MGMKDASAVPAARHQHAMDCLSEIVAHYEAEHGPLTEEEIHAAREELFGGGDVAERRKAT